MQSKKFLKANIRVLTRFFTLKLNADRSVNIPEEMRGFTFFDSCESIYNKSSNGVWFHDNSYSDYPQIISAEHARESFNNCLNAGYICGNVLDPDFTELKPNENELVKFTDTPYNEYKTYFNESGQLIGA